MRSLRTVAIPKPKARNEISGVPTALADQVRACRDIQLTSADKRYAMISIRGEPFDLGH